MPGTNTASAQAFVSPLKGLPQASCCITQLARSAEAQVGSFPKQLSASVMAFCSVVSHALTRIGQVEGSPSTRVTEMPVQVPALAVRSTLLSQIDLLGQAENRPSPTRRATDSRK